MCKILYTLINIENKMTDNVDMNKIINYGCECMHIVDEYVQKLKAYVLHCQTDIKKLELKRLKR